MTTPPFVSVIIPVFNDAADLQLTLTGLEQQTYPQAQFEVIVVDNGSTDRSVKVAQQFPFVRLLYEHHHTASPYSARNRGLEVARGEVIALLDATCVPEPIWLAEAIKAFAQRKADLVGGNVAFRFASERPSVAELYDAMTNIRMREAILLRKVAKTANLLVKRSVFEAIGPFPEGVRSGADVRWTRQVTRAGYKLVFCETAKVNKAARSHWQLLKKQWRVAKNQPAVWAEAGTQPAFSEILRGLVVPPKSQSIKTMVEQSSPVGGRKRFVQFWLMSYAVRLVSHLAYLVSWFQLRRNPAKQTTPARPQ